MSVLNSQGRVFIAMPEMYGDVHEYHGCMRVDSLSKQGRTVTQQMVGRTTVAQLVSISGQWQATLNGVVEYDNASLLRQAFDSSCIVNVQVHFGRAGNPTDFTGYEAAFVLENAIVTDYATTALTARQSSETAQVEETFTITFEEAKWISPSILEVRRSTGSGAVVAMTLCPSLACSSCPECGRLYLLVAEYLDGNTQRFRIMWSDDGGATFSSSVVTPPTTLSLSTNDHLHIACSNQHLFFSVANLVLAVPHSNLIDSVSFTPFVISGVDILYSINKLTSDTGGVYVVSNSASVYYINDALVTETLINLGTGVMNPASGRKSFLFTAFFGNSNHVSRIWTDQGYHTLSTIVGTSPATLLTEDTDKRLWLATDNGKLYCGGTSGYDWSQTANFFPDCVAGMAWLSHSVGYLVAGRFMYRTLNGGFNWQRLPMRDISGTQLLALIQCQDGTVYVGGGLEAGCACLPLSIIPNGAIPAFGRTQ